MKTIANITTKKLFNLSTNNQINNLNVNQKTYSEKIKGSLMQVMIALFLFSIFISIGTINVRRSRNAEAVTSAETIITDVYRRYSSLAFDKGTSFTVDFDHTNKSITIHNANGEKLERISLPQALTYVTVYDDAMVSSMKAKITPDGNITPIFSLYVFDHTNIARLRISLYGFDILKYLRINVYRNIKDKTAKLSDILVFHKKFKPETSKLWTKE